MVDFFYCEKSHPIPKRKDGNWGRFGFLKEKFFEMKRKYIQVKLEQLNAKYKFIKN